MTELNELDELRLKIATLKGYTFWDSIDKLGPWARKGNPRAADYAGGIPLYKVDNPKSTRITWGDDDPDWSHDIAAAWELVEEVPSNRWFASIDRDDTRWLCFFGSNISSEDEYYHGEGQSAPEAICRAWLAWKESTQ